MFQQDLNPLETRLKSLSQHLDVESSELMYLMLEILKTQQAQISEIPALRSRIKELELRLSKDSKNSHKPPSSDGAKKASGTAILHGVQIRELKTKKGRQICSSNTTKNAYSITPQRS